MHIGLVNSEYPKQGSSAHGGIASYVYIMADALLKKNHAVTIFLRESTIPDTLHHDCGIAYFGFRGPETIGEKICSRLFHIRHSWDHGCSVGLLHALLQRHAQSKLDIVEIPEYQGLACAFTKKLPFCTIVALHTPTMLIHLLNETYSTSKNDQRTYRLEQSTINNADAIRCPSYALVKKLKECTISIPKEPIIIKNPMPICHDFHQITSSKKKKQTIEILFAGRLERRKGSHLLSEVIPRILAIDKSINCTIAGDDTACGRNSYSNRIRSCIDQAQHHRLNVLGSLSHDQLKQYYSQIDLCIVMSLFENSPYCILEAMATSVPVIGADVEGVNEMITNTVTGLLFPIDNLNILYERIQTLLTDDTLRTKLCTNALNYLKHVHDPATIADQSLDLYQSTIHKKKRGA